MSVFHGATYFFHEPARLSNAAPPWESGAEDARTPDAGAWSADSAASEAFGVRLIYRHFHSGAGSQWFMVSMHPEKKERGRYICRSFN